MYTVYIYTVSHNYTCTVNVYVEATCNSEAISVTAYTLEPLFEGQPLYKGHYPYLQQCTSVWS